MKSILLFKSRILLGLVLAFAAGLASSCGRSIQDSNSANGQNADGRGQQIVDEYLKRDSSPYRKSRIRFTVTEEGEAAKVYEIESWRKEAADATTTLNEIIAPPDESGTRTLTIEAKGKKTVVVTYAASRDEFRETDSKKMFIGGLTIGELLGDWDKFDYQFIGEKDLGGVKVLEVEGRLKNGADSIISRMNVLFRTDNYIPMETHFFGTDGREIRTYKTTATIDDPAHPYASKIDVDNSVYKAHIVIEIVSREFPASIDDSMFTRDKLKESVKK